MFAKIALFVALSSVAQAQVEDSTIDYLTSDMQTVVEATVQSFTDMTQAHFKAHEETGVGLLYGVRSRYAKMTKEQQRAYIARVKKPGTHPAMPQPTFCIGYVMRHLKAGYLAAGKDVRWAEIERAVKKADYRGTDLLIELQKDGWEMIYWNPDVNKALDNDPKHAYTYTIVKRGKPYYGIKIDEMMINYRPAPGSSTVRETSQLEKLRRVPMWVGIANAAYHVFLGYGDRVNESHSPMMPDDVTNIEDGPFLRFGTKGSVKYLNGVIAVPPGSWR